MSEHTEKIVYFLYKLSSRYKIELLNNNMFKNLKGISLFKPTVDAATIIGLEYLFEPSPLRNNI
ncbi:hypothetical protein CYG68_19390 [Morganella morganii]|uniref:Uncharacterized protein n=1 Tax=Morganella morganii TaxID=582 RepID=A0A8I0Q5D5_MORMO|nr:hypothetical protein [Morganella morganii]